VLDQSLSISEFDGLGEEAVTQSGREGQNATVPLARWQEVEEFM